MDHVEAVATATEPDLDEALARAIRQLILGASERPAESSPEHSKSAA
jgi:hypothetical protein